MEAAPARSARVKGGVAVLVVGGPLLRIAQGLVSLSDLLEFVLGRFIARIFVRMKLHGQFAIGPFNLLVTGGAFHAQDFVIVALGHLLIGFEF